MSPSSSHTGLIALAGMVALLAGPAFATESEAGIDQEGRSPEEMAQAFADTDGNRDGFVTQEELALAGVDPDISQVDNGDGRLDEQEFAALGPEAPIGGGLTGAPGDDETGSGFGGGATAGATASDGGGD